MDVEFLQRMIDELILARQHIINELLRINEYILQLDYELKYLNRSNEYNVNSDNKFFQCNTLHNRLERIHFPFRVFYRAANCPDRSTQTESMHFSLEEPMDIE